MVAVVYAVRSPLTQLVCATRSPSPIEKHVMCHRGRPYRRAAAPLALVLILTLLPTLATAGPPGPELARFVGAVLIALLVAALLTLGWHVLLMVGLGRSEKPSTLLLTLGALTCLGDGLSALSSLPVLFGSTSVEGRVIWGVIIGICVIGSGVMGLFTRRAWLRAKAS